MEDRIKRENSVVMNDTKQASVQETNGPRPRGKEKKTNVKTEILSWVRDITIAVVVALLISRVITPTIVQEHSMEDTLQDRNYLILLRTAYKFGNEPEYGDIVVFRSDLVNEQNGKNKLLIKRVIAKGGDTVAIRDGVVYRNGEALDEPYTKDGYTSGAMDETLVPDGTLFLCGDNRLVSLDSRSEQVGFIEEERLIGKAVFRLFPFNEIGSVYKNVTENEEASGNY